MQTIDFSTWTPRCSSLGLLDPDNIESYDDLYNETVKKWQSKQKELMTTSEKAIKTAEKLFDECEKLEAKVNKLKPMIGKYKLTQGAQTHLCDIYNSVVYGRHEDFENKYIEKGLLLEEDAISLWSEVTKTMYRKNKTRQNDGTIEGECDIDHDEIFDTKVNWSIVQFTRLVSKPLLKRYYWQMKGYLRLFKKESGKVVYTLLNTPEHLILAEQKKLVYRFSGSAEDCQAACDELRHMLTYDDIPQKERVRVFTVKRDEEDDFKIEKAVAAARQFLSDIQNKIYDDSKEYSDD